MSRPLILFSISFGLLLSCSKDNSLDTQDYVDLGLPDINSEWGFNDYKTCIDVLTEIRDEDFKSLPRLKSEKSQAVFNRIIATENIDKLFKEPRQGNPQKLIIELVKLYSDEIDDKLVYPEELIEFQILSIKLTDRTFAELKNIPNIDYSDPETQNLIQQMAIGYKDQMIKSIDIQVKYQTTYSEEDLNKLNSWVSKSIINQKHFLDSAIRQEITDKIREAINLTASDKIRTNYSAVLRDLQTDH